MMTRRNSRYLLRRFGVTNWEGDWEMAYQSVLNYIKRHERIIESLAGIRACEFSPSIHRSLEYLTTNDECNIFLVDLLTEEVKRFDSPAHLLASRTDCGVITVNLDKRLVLIEGDQKVTRGELINTFGLGPLKVTLRWVRTGVERKITLDDPEEQNEEDSPKMSIREKRFKNLLEKYESLANCTVPISVDESYESSVNRVRNYIMERDCSNFVLVEVDLPQSKTPPKLVCFPKDYACPGSLKILKSSRTGKPLIYSIKLEKSDNLVFSRLSLCWKRECRSMRVPDKTLQFTSIKQMPLNLRYSHLAKSFTKISRLK